MQKETFEIKLLLPSIPDKRDTCIRRLTEMLDAKDGIARAHVKRLGTDGQDAICVHFDAKQISLSEVRDFAKRAGAELDARYGHILFRSTARHAGRAKTLESQLKTLHGVVDANVSPTGTIRIEFDRRLVADATIRSNLQTLRIGPVETSPEQTELIAARTPPKPDAHEHEHEGLFGEQSELYAAIAGGGLLLLGWILAFFAQIDDWMSTSLFVAAFVFSGFFTFREAFQNLRIGRFEIDSLMLLAAIGAATLGNWMEGALLLFLFGLGHALEHYAMGRAKREIEALGKLAPETATVRRDGLEKPLPVEQLQVGDVAIIKPNERIPADGVVTKGESSVNQAPITGESVPVDKRPIGDPGSAERTFDSLEAQNRLFAGTINGSGALEMRVMRLNRDSTLARVVQMVSEAETQKSPTQRFTDKFEKYFVPATVALGCLLLFAWVVVDEPFSESFYRAMAVLVAASPCALAIATPSAVLSGVARAARGGVLIKGGAPLEHLGRLNSIAFDKTGTLTEGKPRLTDVITHGGFSKEELLSFAVAVEKLSDHPLAAAVVRGVSERQRNVRDQKAQDVRAIVGRGVQATVGGVPVYIGKDELFSEIDGPQLPEELKANVERLKSSGRTIMIVRRQNDYLGALGLMDTPRAGAKDVIGQLSRLGIERMIMLSGDNQQVADAIAGEIGIHEARGDLMPDDKVQAIKSLGRDKGIAMVGDGVNDAPAMASATVGVAMGAAGSDVALETADVALMDDNLATLPFAVGLSRQTSRIIRQNLWFSLGMVVILVPATILGLKMGAAVVFHEGSTLLVVGNALRLLAYKPE